MNGNAARSQHCAAQHTLPQAILSGQVSNTYLVWLRLIDPHEINGRHALTRDNEIPQAANYLKLDFDHVAILEQTDAACRAALNQIAGLKHVPGRNVGDNLSRTEQH